MMMMMVVKECNVQKCTGEVDDLIGEERMNARRWTGWRMEDGG